MTFQNNAAHYLCKKCSTTVWREGGMSAGLNHLRSAHDETDAQYIEVQSRRIVAYNPQQRNFNSYQPTCPYHDSKKDAYGHCSVCQKRYRQEKAVEEGPLQ